jgi:hypothetical protein
MAKSSSSTGSSACAQAPEAQQHGGDALLCAVVEVALDALALRVGHLDQARA